MTTQLDTSSSTFAAHPGITFFGMALIVTALSTLSQYGLLLYVLGATAWVVFTVLMAIFERIGLRFHAPNRQLAERLLRGAIAGTLATLTPFFMWISVLRGTLAWDVLLRGASEYRILIPGAVCGALAVCVSHWYRSKAYSGPSRLWWILVGTVTVASAFLWTA